MRNENIPHWARCARVIDANTSKKFISLAALLKHNSVNRSGSNLQPWLGQGVKVRRGKGLGVKGVIKPWRMGTSRARHTHLAKCLRKVCCLFGLNSNLPRGSARLGNASSCEREMRRVRVCVRIPMSEHFEELGGAHLDGNTQDIVTSACGHGHSANDRVRGRQPVANRRSAPFRHRPARPSCDQLPSTCMGWAVGMSADVHRFNMSTQMRCVI